MINDYDPFTIPEAHDQPLGIRGARRDGLIKYDSNLVAVGDHNEVQGHHSNIEDLDNVSVIPLEIIERGWHNAEIWMEF